MEHTIFENERITGLLEEYLAKPEDERDTRLLAQIVGVECKGVLTFLSGKYDNPTVTQEDLMQEARLKLIQVIHLYDPSRGTLFSYISNVARNVMVDYLRKHGKPNTDLHDIEDTGDGITDFEYLATLEYQLLEWFQGRFPTMIPVHLSQEVLESLLTDILDENCGPRKIVKYLQEDFGLTRQDATLIHGAVVLKLRLLVGEVKRNSTKPPERSYHPELATVIGYDNYERTRKIFSGYNLRFKKGEE